MSVFGERSSFYLSPADTSVQQPAKLAWPAKQMENCWLLAEFRFDVLVTIDKNIRYQQNLTRRDVAILVLRARSNDIGDLRL